MDSYAGFVDQTGLLDAFSAAGIGWWWEGGGLWVSNLTAAQAIVAAYNPLPAEQAAAIATVEVALASLIAAGLVIGSSTVAIDPTTQSEINQLCNLAHVTIAGLTSVVWPTSPTRYWPVISGPPIALGTPQDALAIGVPAAHYVWSLKNYADTLAAQIMAETTSAGVASVLSGASWPTS
ncbi:hypothetical protein [Acidiphilium angustum]|uniref:hypothetical protein n=1 Tax=Acidiphilium angustum TaxID=523 RepID=UPI000494A136|nr:hypothetical protein [Acidiphilium angustum]